MSVAGIRIELERRADGSAWLGRAEVDALGCDRYDLGRNAHREVVMARLVAGLEGQLAGVPDLWAAYSAGVAFLSGLDPREHAAELVEPDEVLVEWAGLGRNASYVEQARLHGQLRPGSVPLHFLREAQYLYWLDVVEEAATALSARLATIESAAYESSAFAFFDDHWTVDESQLQGPSDGEREQVAG